MAQAQAGHLRIQLRQVMVVVVMTAEEMVTILAHHIRHRTIVLLLTVEETGEISMLHRTEEQRRLRIRIIPTIEGLLKRHLTMAMDSMRLQPLRNLTGLLFF